MPLDFAYRLHSEIGAACTGARINGKMVSLNTKLKSGDIVEIITAKNSQPNPGWLDKVGSKHARHKLLSQLHALFPNFVASPEQNAVKAALKAEKAAAKKKAKAAAKNNKK